MLKPSKNFVCYDAQTFEEEGFIQVSGKVRKMAEKPRYWSVYVSVLTQDPDKEEVQKKEFGFKTPSRFMLSELAPIVNERIHLDDDYLPDCISVMVCAKIMTEGGK